MSSEEGLAIRSNWWWSHVAVVGWTLVLYLFVVLNALVLNLDPVGTFFAVQGWLFVYVTFGIAALFGFFYDTKAIKDAGKAWAPRWWVYLLASFVVSPSVTGILYLFQRARHVGIAARGRQFGPMD